MRHSSTDHRRPADDDRPCDDAVPSTTLDPCAALVVDSLPWLIGWVMRYRGFARLGAEHVMDIVQDVCIEALHSRPSFAPQSDAAGRAWLRTIARRRLADRVRHWNAAKREVSRRVPLSNVEEDLVLVHTPSEAATSREQRARISAAIQDLPSGQRDVLNEQWLRGRTTAEIARALGRSVNAVRLLRSRGVAAVRDALRASE